MEISVDLACGQCGYNLRGLRADARCPECAFPISESIEIVRTPVRPEELARLREGLSLLMRCVGGVALVFLAAVAAIEFLGSAQVGGTAVAPLVGWGYLIATTALVGVAALAMRWCRPSRAARAVAWALALTIGVRMAFLCCHAGRRPEVFLAPATTFLLAASAGVFLGGLRRVAPRLRVGASPWLPLPLVLLAAEATVSSISDLPTPAVARGSYFLVNTLTLAVSFVVLWRSRSRLARAVPSALLPGPQAGAGEKRSSAVIACRA